MKKYPLLISSKSQDEIIDIWKYIAHESQDIETADMVIQKIEKFCSTKLVYFPEMGVSKNSIAEGIRFFPVGSYGIYYFFDGEQVYVAHILHQSKNIKNIF